MRLPSLAIATAVLNIEQIRMNTVRQVKLNISTEPLWMEHMIMFTVSRRVCDDSQCKTLYTLTDSSQLP